MKQGRPHSAVGIAVVGCGPPWSQGPPVKDMRKCKTERWSRIKANSLGGLGKCLMSQLNIYVFISTYACFSQNRARVLHVFAINVQPKS